MPYKLVVKIEQTRPSSDWKNGRALIRRQAEIQRSTISRSADRGPVKNRIISLTPKTDGSS
jgi:hypothetical protein